MKVVIDENIPFVKGRLEPFASTVYASQNEIGPATVADADVLIVRTRTRCDASLLQNSKVRLVATATIGVDHIDLGWCGANGVDVVNAPGCNAPGVAQYVWSSVLRLRGGVKGMKVGVVGCGNVGGIVADWGRRLGAEVFVSDPPRRDAGILDNYMDLDVMLRECDVITLHTPLTRDGKYPTFHLIGAAELSEMASSGSAPRLIINAARGEVVDNGALVKALVDGGIEAVVDTWENEPDINRSLLALAKIATPHIAGYSEEGKQRATRMVLEAMDRKFGIETDKSGLAGAYVVPDEIEPEKIIGSYNPFADTLALRENPEAFERLRHDYNYRKEVKF